jgi:hypothetical protein
MRWIERAATGMLVIALLHTGSASPGLRVAWGAIGRAAPEWVEPLDWNLWHTRLHAEASAADGAIRLEVGVESELTDVEISWRSRG